MLHNSSKEIARAIDAYLKENDWNFEISEDNEVFRFNVTMECKIKTLSYMIRVSEDDYCVYATSPIGADAGQMTAMAEFVCRANYGLCNGCFELDFRDGELRYKSFVDCEGAIPTAEIIRNSIHLPALMFERYCDGIVGILLGSMNAKDAVEHCEKR